MGVLHIKEAESRGDRAEAESESYTSCRGWINIGYSNGLSDCNKI
jgi:hypothetical protein